MKLLYSLLVFALSVGPIVYIESAPQSPTIPSVEYCSLITAPESYAGKEIRVHGVYLVAGNSVSQFFSSSCQDGKSVWVEFNSDYRSCSGSKVVQRLEQMRRKSGFRWARPHVTVVTGEFRSAEAEFVGTFIKDNPYKPDSEDAGPLGPILSDRQRADSVFRVACIKELKPLRAER